MTISDVEPMSWASILGVQVFPIKCAPSSNNSRIREVESRFASKNLELDVATAELESMECRLRFPEDAVSFMLERVQDQRPQILKVEPSSVAAQVARAAAESNVQSLTASE